MAIENSRKRKEWEPKQVELKEPLDLRHAALGPRGYKLKPVKTGTRTLEKIRRAQEQPVEQPMDHDGEVEVAPAVKRQKAEGVPYRNVSNLFESNRLRFTVQGQQISILKVVGGSSSHKTTLQWMGGWDTYRSGYLQPSCEKQSSQLQHS